MWALPTYEWGIQWVVAPESNAPLRGPLMWFESMRPRFADFAYLSILMLTMVPLLVLLFWAMAASVVAVGRLLPVRAYDGVRVCGKWWQLNWMCLVNFLGTQGSRRIETGVGGVFV